MPSATRCSSCELRGRCIWRDLTQGPDVSAAAHIYRADEPVFEAGEPCADLNVVRSGVVKSYSISRNGDEQVLGFFYPGSVLGLEGLGEGVHVTYAISVGTSSVCTIPRDSLLAGAGNQEMLGALLRVMGDSVANGARAQLHLGIPSAEQRIATFLLETSRHYQRQGYSASEIRLPMRRMDIARYLSLAIETVSRAFRKLEDAGLVQVDPGDRHRITIPSLEALERRAQAGSEAVVLPAQGRGLTEVKQRAA